MNERVFKPCAVIPVYNHWLVLEDLVKDLGDFGLPLILVDDGSNEQCKSVLMKVADAAQVTLVTRSSNGGKGIAVKDGLRLAEERGFTHALQLDADGQHNRRDVPRFLAASKQNPDALISGYPVYDDSVPGHRLYGRYATHIWVWINTLSLEIKDSMCGFRVYPLQASGLLLDQSAMGNRMDFDTEFLVRWHWSRRPLVQLETAVTYTDGAVSHFHLWLDNALISRMHARLFLGMLWRFPRLLVSRKRPGESFDVR